MTWTVQTFIDNTRLQMDAEASNRWSDDVIRSVGGMVHQSEWSGILNANPNYRVGHRAVVTDAQGRIAIADLSVGTGDDREIFYRVLTGPTDGQVLWRETDLIYVPTGTTQNYQNPYEYLYYLAGDFFQLLPLQTGLALTVDVNWRPTSIADLTDVQTSIIDFPEGCEWLLAFVSAGTLLTKGGAESQAAADLFAIASDMRRRMLGDTGRRTTRPTQARFVDSPAAWAG